MSLILLVALAGYSGNEVYSVILRLDPTVTKNSYRLTQEDNETPFRPQDYGFDLAFGFNDVDLDPSIGYFTL